MVDSDAVVDSDQWVVPAEVGESADFGTRFAAYMVDGLILFGLQWIVAMAVARQMQTAGMTSVEPCSAGPDADPTVLCRGPNTLAWTVLFLIISLSTFAWHCWFDGRRGATPAKRWLGLAVVDRVIGGPIGLPRGAGRAVIRQAVWLFAFVFVAGSPIALEVPGPMFFALFGLSVLTLVWAGFAPDGRGLHDRLVDSIVVRVDTGPTSASARIVEPTPVEATPAGSDAGPFSSRSSRPHS